MSWSDCPAAIPPPRLFGLLEASFGEQQGSPKFRCRPLDDLPWTQTPARPCTLALTRARLLASRKWNLWPCGYDEHFGAQYLHLRYGRPSAIPLASRNSLPPYVQSSVLARWL